MSEPTASDVARRRRVKVLYEGKSCARCGETDADMLGCYSKIDLHHVIGKAHDPDLVVYLCRSCHAYAHARLKELGIVDLSPKPARNLLEVVTILLRAIGHTLREWGESFADYADRLADLMESLDATAPAWRELAEAKL
jgi:hypothetical protein